MRTEANNHQTQMEDVVKNLTKSEGLEKILQDDGNIPWRRSDSLEALEFLCLAEAGELNHHEVLNAMTKGIKNKQVTSTINSILEEEQKHLLLCTQLAKKIATAAE